MLRTPYEPICAVCVAKYVKLEDMWVTRYTLQGYTRKRLSVVLCDALDHTVVQ